MNFIKNYIYDDKFKLTIYTNEIHINNYKEIIEINDHKIEFKFDIGKMYITGKNLILNKLLDNEILISGQTISVEVKYE